MMARLAGWDGLTGEEPVCGDGTCSVGENCPADASGCLDNICYEPTCTNGCGQIAVVSGGNDEICLVPNHCDGSGNCGDIECDLAVDCEDNLFCNGIEECINHFCVSEVNPCNDGLSCTVDSCFESTDTCTNIQVHSNCNDNNSAQMIHVNYQVELQSQDVNLLMMTQHMQ